MSKLAELRARHHIPKKELAKKLNVSVTSISRWERDITRVRGDNLVKLADELQCSVDELLGILEIGGKL